MSNGQTALTFDVLQKLEDTVRRFIEEGRAFTAYNVTLATRQEHGLQLRHQTVQEAGNPVHEFPALRDAMEFADFCQTRIDHPKQSGVWAWLYHPVSYDLSTFVWEKGQTATPDHARTDHAQQVFDQQKLDDQAAAVQNPGGQQNDGNFVLDYRNRLFVPTDFVRSIGLSPYNTIYVVADSDNSVIYLTDNADRFDNGVSRITTQTVERNGDLRLSASTLRAAELDTDDNGDSIKRFSIVTEDDGTNKAVKITAA